MVIKAVSDLIADDAVISLDCGANTHFAARNLMLRSGQRLTGTGMMASMAPGLPFAIAGSFAYPDRQSVAIAAASRRSVLASLPVDRAKSRI
jgi:pyruvate dehydrogenase (quinone)/pyruvate decarboxylase